MRTGTRTTQRRGGLYVASEFYQLTDGFSVAVDHNTGAGAHMSAMRFQHTGFAWESVLGDAWTGPATAMHQTADGGYIVGASQVLGFDEAALIVRLADNGVVQWGRTVSIPNSVTKTRTSSRRTMDSCCSLRHGLSGFPKRSPTS